MDGIPKLDHSLFAEKASLLKINKLKVIMLSVIAGVLFISIYLYTCRPTFSASHELTGDEENRVYVIETVVPRGSLVTMYKDKVFVDESIASKSGLVTTNRAEEQPADKNGKAAFKIFPGQLNSGANAIHFEVKAKTGIRKSFYYTLNKTTMPVTLKVNITDELVNNENIKKVLVQTDPFNTVYIDGFINEFHSITGQDVFKIKDYDILKSANKDPGNLPDALVASVQVCVTDVDGQKKSEKVQLVVCALTNLLLEHPPETESNTTTISGKASPGASISVGEQNVVADENGNFKFPVPLLKYGPNIINFIASRPGEKASAKSITINRLVPQVELKIETQNVKGRDLTIEGSVIPGATVTVNGQPTAVNDKKFSWYYEFPYGVSKEYIFNIKAQKPGYRSGEEKVTVHRMPVIRKPSPDDLTDSDQYLESLTPKDEVLK